MILGVAGIAFADGEAPRTSTRSRQSASPVSRELNADAKPYTLVLTEFAVPREVMDDALSGKNPYDALRTAVKAGKGEVKNYSGGGVIGDTSNRSIQVNSEIPVVVGVSRSSGGEKSSSITYHSVGVSLNFTLGKPEGPLAVANVSYRSSGMLPGTQIDGVAQNIVYSFQAAGAVKIESGVPALLVSGEASGDESHRARAVFVRADW